MPKMKTKGAAKKRFNVTGNGKVKFKQSFSRHMMMNKPKSMKRKARGMTILNDSDAKIILDNFLPYERGLKKGKKSPSPAESAAKKAAANANVKTKKTPAKKAAPAATPKAAVKTTTKKAAPTSKNTASKKGE